MLRKLCMEIGDAVRQARKGSGLTQEALGRMAGGVSRQSVALLEKGGGRMTTLQKVGPHIHFRINGLASGDTAQEQVRRSRGQKGYTQVELAKKAGLSVPTVRAVEFGVASVASLSAIIACLAPNARVSMPLRAHWQIKRDVRFTPPHILEQVEAVFGGISIDVAGDHRSFVRADIVLTEEEDGLSARWSGRLAFCNPPYSDLTRWIARCADAWERAEVEMIIGLFPARTETFDLPGKGLRCRRRPALAAPSFVL